jgi:hypothetical protein
MCIKRCLKYGNKFVYISQCWLVLSSKWVVEGVASQGLPLGKLICKEFFILGGKIEQGYVWVYVPLKI